MKKENTYSEKLRDPRWQKKRLEVMSRDKFTCVDCGAADKTLNVHHSYYSKGREVWDYPMFSLKTVCEKCHELYGVDKGEESSQSELECTIDMFLAGNPDVSPALWEISTIISQLKTAGLSGFDVDKAIMDGLLRLWVEKVGEPKPYLFTGPKDNRMPWIPEWYANNVEPPK